MTKFLFNPFTSNFDAYTNAFGETGIYLTDSDGVKWQLQVDTAGVLYTTQVVVAGSATFDFTDNTDFYFVNGTTGFDYIT